MVKNWNKALEKTGNRSGICGEKWRKNNPNKVFENNRKGGLKGGYITGNMFWWNNGIKNKKSFSSPGIEWKRGMLMSEKKRNQVMEKFAGHNKKGKKYV